MAVKKDFWAAFILNVVLAGSGHVYVGEKDKGTKLLAAYVLAWLLASPLGFPFFIAVAIWIYTLVDTRNVVDAFNTKVDEYLAAQQAELEKNILNTDILIQKIRTSQELLKSEMIDESEFMDRKVAIIAELAEKEFQGELDELLLALIPLKEEGLLSAEEITRIKGHFS